MPPPSAPPIMSQPHRRPHRAFGALPLYSRLLGNEALVSVCSLAHKAEARSTHLQQSGKACPYRKEQPKTSLSHTHVCASSALKFYWRLHRQPSTSSPSHPPLRSFLKRICSEAEALGAGVFCCVFALRKRQASWHVSNGAKPYLPAAEGILG